MKKIRPECRECLHRWTHVCTDCRRHLHNYTKLDQLEDHWEKEEHKRDDGNFVCDSCGHLSADREKCDRCGWGFPAAWQDLPVAAVPPLGDFEEDR